MSFPEDFSNDKLVSEFNEAGYQIQRLHFLYTLCNNFAIKGEFKEWNWRLDRIAIELSTDMIDEDGIEKSEKLDSFYQRLKLINEDISKSWNNKEKLYQFLMQKECLLRLLQNKAGKGSKKREEDEDAMD